MKTPKYIKSSEKKQITAELESLYGIQKIPHLLIQTGKEKIRGFTGSMSKEEINEISKLTNLEIIGVYLFKEEGSGLRLSIEATQFFNDQIDKNIVQLTDEQLEDYFKGQEPKIEAEKGLKVLKNKETPITSAISNGDKISNFIPKERRIRRT